MIDEGDKRRGLSMKNGAAGGEKISRESVRVD
jgi:hypothetical protein